jgi:hypothetical protein
MEKLCFNSPQTGYWICVSVGFTGEWNLNPPWLIAAVNARENLNFLVNINIIDVYECKSSLETSRIGLDIKYLILQDARLGRHEMSLDPGRRPATCKTILWNPPLSTAIGRASERDARPGGSGIRRRIQVARLPRQQPELLMQPCRQASWVGPHCCAQD